MESSRVGQELINLKTKIDLIERSILKEKGRLSSLYDELKKTGCKNTKIAKRKIKQINKEIYIKEQIVKKGIKKLKTCL